MLLKATQVEAAQDRLKPRRLLEYGVVAAIVAAVAVAAVGVLSGNWQISPILSGSMRPGFPIGGVVVTKRTPLPDLRVGDIAVLREPIAPHVLYTHRIISLRREGSTDVIRTKGDDNLEADPWTLRVHDRDVDIAQFTLPLLGYVAVWAHSPGGRRDLLIVAAALIALLLASVFFERRRAAAHRAARSPSSALEAITQESRQP